MSMTHYCLGNGALKCDGCLQEKNWQTLNQMPNALRLQLQAGMQRISDDECILRGRPWYVAAAQGGASPTQGASNVHD